MKPLNENWITYYLARNEGEFEYVLAEIKPPRRSGNTLLNMLYLCRTGTIFPQNYYLFICNK